MHSTGKMQSPVVRYPRLLVIVRFFFYLEALAFFVWQALVLAAAIDGSVGDLVPLAVAAFHTTIIQALAFFAEDIRTETQQQQQLAVDRPLIWIFLGATAATADLYTFIFNVREALAAVSSRWFFIWQATLSAYLTTSAFVFLSIIVYVYVDTRRSADRNSLPAPKYMPLTPTNQRVLF